MLAVMYGMIPSAKTDRRSSEPPLKRFTRLTSEPLLAVSLMHCCTAG
ncbi:hypothetical protein GCM10025868_32960 [Angustibacter aerolatus]|uniref:Uncharacterized protein n=1 Tax=Angustibacter aerolatus TaxID=1162965 RepID=A0ABQ6JIH7_9ACTN|nr:hypothetical protein GCM10025868_32960 [Angustibacter aerolatus]